MAASDNDRALERAVGAATYARLAFPRANARNAGNAGWAMGLDGRALQVLIVLSAEPGASGRQIAERLALDESSVRHAMRELVKRGLVRPRELGDRPDFRRKPQALTEVGRQLLDAYADWLHSQVRRHAAGPGFPRLR